MGLKRKGDFYGQEVLYSRADYQEAEGSGGDAGAAAPLNDPKGVPSPNWFVEDFIQKSKEKKKHKGHKEQRHKKKKHKGEHHDDD